MAYKKQDSEKIEEITEKIKTIKKFMIDIDRKVTKDVVETHLKNLVDKKTQKENAIEKDREEVKKCIDVINSDEEIKNRKKQISKLEKVMENKNNSIEYLKKLKDKLENTNNLLKIIIMLGELDNIAEEALKKGVPIEDKIEDEARRLKLDLKRKDISNIQNFLEERYKGISLNYNNVKAALDNENKKLNSEISKINNLIKSLSKNLISCELVIDGNYGIFKLEKSPKGLKIRGGDLVHIINIKISRDIKNSEFIDFLKKNKLDMVLEKDLEDNKNKEKLILNENSINIINEKIKLVESNIENLNKSYEKLLNKKIKKENKLDEIISDKINSDEKIKNLNKSIEDREKELKNIDLDSKIKEFKEILDNLNNTGALFSIAFFNKIIKEAENSSIIIKNTNTAKIDEIIKKLEEFKNKDFDPNEIKNVWAYLLEQREFLINIVTRLDNRKTYYINKEEILKSDIKEKESLYGNIKEKGPIENTQRKIYDETSFEK